MKADRLLSSLMLLQAHGRLSTRQLAQRLEISTRTAHRDMEALGVAGVPIIALRGSKGGWELEKDWRTKVPGFDETELRALLMAQPSALGDPRLAAAAARALAKLVAAMPSSMRTQAASIQARLFIDTTGWRPSSEDLSMLPIVQDAIVGDLKLSFVYARADGSTAPRTVDPFGIVCKQSVWYLVARAPAGMRTYRVSRMSNALVLAVRFDRPADFDLARYWKASTAQLEQQRQPLTATLALSPAAVESLNRWCRTSPAENFPGDTGIPADWVILNVDFESLSQARFVALGFGSDAHVFAPAKLCDRIRSDIDKLIARRIPSSRRLRTAAQNCD
jgi:predicted DNA-binding transcriptional regulator YafY